MENNETKLRTNYILIDYENVQPKSFELIGNHPFKTMVFVGSNQTKISLELAATLQALGTRAEYVRIEGHGTNALDFHIAFYIGKLSENDPEGYFHIISKDTGFDPLILHLKAKKIRVQREKEISEIPILKISNASTSDEKICSIINHLISRGNAKPRKITTLSNTINNLFMNSLAENELKALVDILIKKGIVTIDNANVHYNLQ